MLRRPHATYETADILTYAPRETYDAILLREVIYDLPPGQVSGFLARLSGFLAPSGVILIQVWAGERSSGLAAAIERNELQEMLEKSLELGAGNKVVSAVHWAGVMRSLTHE